MKSCHTYTLAHRERHSMELTLGQHMQQVKEMYNLYLEIKRLNETLALQPAKCAKKSI